MGLSQPRVIFGIHSVTFYNPQNGIPYGMLQVLGNGTFEMTGEQIKLKGGSNKFDWDVEDGNIEANLNITLKEYPDYLIALFLGKTPTKIAASAVGTVSTLKNKKGTSIMNATNGISAVAATTGSEANLKFAKYTIIATDPNSVDVYASTNVDFANGTDGDFLDDSLKIGTIDVTVGAIPLAVFGLTFTGVGTPAFVVGDTATFEVLPPHQGSSEAIIGGLSDAFPKFGALIVTQKLASGEMFEIDCPNCKGSGLNLGGAEKAFTETPITAAVAYDAGLGGIAKIRACKPVIL